MSGKAAGKKRNRAAQSEQHGYQESPTDIADKSGTVGVNGSGGTPETEERKRVSEKLRNLERSRRDKDQGKDRDQPH
ncbi:MAG TPA: hypothetical protein ENH44_01575 [Actinobacteria bacterium]|nr:hypothetical protein [Actinomycetota bacterium]